MSWRKKSDYKALMKAVFELLLRTPSVKRTTLHYRRAVLSVLRKLMPAVTIQGCCFHRKQAGLWRKVQEPGPTIVIPSRPRYLPIASQVHGLTIPSSRRHSRSVLQAEKKGQHRPAESLRQLRRTELDRHQHLAAVLLECLPKSHPDKQGRRRIAQRAQQTSAVREKVSFPCTC